MSDAAVETKPDGAETVQSPAPDAAKPDGAAGTGGGETTTATPAPSNEPDWKAKFTDLESKYNQISTQVPSLVKGMNEAQQRAAFYEKQAQALVNVQPPQKDELETLAEQAGELEYAGRFAEAAPIRAQLAVKAAERASERTFQRMTQQRSMQDTQTAVQRILKEKYGLDPSLASDLSTKAAASPEAIAQAMAMAHDPELVTKATLKDVEDRKKASERASLTQSFGGGSGGRGIPGNGNTQKPRMSHITYSALPQSRKDEIKAMALEGKLDLYTVTGRGAQERVEVIDPRDL